MSESKGNAWLARDGDDEQPGDYYLHENKPVWDDAELVWRARGANAKFVDDNIIFSGCVPDDLRLAPGEGPVPVRITIERADNP